MDSGVHASLKVNCHDPISFANFGLQIYYSPPYKSVMWHYKHAKTDHIRKDIFSFNWEMYFANKDLNEMVNIFNETICNVKTWISMH